MFGIILNYLRYININYSEMTKHELNHLLKEAEYYELGPIIDYLKSKQTAIQFVKLHVNNYYYSGNRLVGTNKLSDLYDINLNTGICTGYTGVIEIELDRQYEFEKIELGGFCGDVNFGYNSGAGAQILTSKDKQVWNSVGRIPYDIEKIVNLSIKRTFAKYIKFDSTGYIGLGYLKIIPN